MGFHSDTYRTAAREHVVAAGELYAAGRYALALYVAGLAAECMLRAYRVRTAAEFDERHDLWELYKGSGLAGAVSERHQENLGAALGTLRLQWDNGHRYRSEDALRQYLRKKKLDRRIRGDFLKENARRAVEAALEIVTLGESRWYR